MVDDRLTADIFPGSKVKYGKYSKASCNSNYSIINSIKHTHIYI